MANWKPTWLKSIISILVIILSPLILLIISGGIAYIGALFFGGIGFGRTTKLMFFVAGILVYVVWSLFQKKR